MSVENNKRLLQSFVKDVIDGKSLNAADKYLLRNFFHHDLAPGEQTGNQTGLAGTKKFFASVVFPGFSDFKTSFADMIGEKDLVAGRWTQSVRQTGPWLGRPPTNREASVQGISIVRVRNNMIVEEWEVRDSAALLVTFGVIPKPKPLEPATANGNPVVALPPITRVLTGGPLMPQITAGVGTPGGSVATAPGVDVNLNDLKSIAGHYISDVWNRGAIEEVNKILAPGFVDHHPLDGQIPGPSGIRQFIQRFKNAFPDSTITPDIILAEGDKVVTRWTAMGSHKGQFLGLPPSGSRLTLAGINIFRVQGQQIVEKWGNWPIAETVGQLSAAGPS